MNTKNLFFIGLVVAASGLISTPWALLAGLIYGLSFAHPYHLDSKKLSAFLLQASIVALGFGMNLHEVVRAGRNGFLYTAISISFALLLGLALGHLFKVQRTSALLISAGTAICGGSAIAAVGPVFNAGEEEMAVSLGTVFALNSVALFLFPAIGYALHLTQSQFGLWSALAIHDTSSVVGATAKYGSQALMIGTTIKLARALVDCSPGVCGGHPAQEQDPNPLALVHPAFLPGRGGRNLLALVRPALSTAQYAGKVRVDGYPLSDRNGDFQINLEAGGSAPARAGDPALGDCGHRVSDPHPLGNHRRLIKGSDE